MVEQCTADGKLGLIGSTAIDDDFLVHCRFQNLERKVLLCSNAYSVRA